MLEVIVKCRNNFRRWVRTKETICIFIARMCPCQGCVVHCTIITPTSSPLSGLHIIILSSLIKFLRASLCWLGKLFPMGPKNVPARLSLISSHTSPNACSDSLERAQGTFECTSNGRYQNHRGNYPNGSYTYQELG